MKSTHRRRQPARAPEILRYYLENPQAIETMEGIAEWRLLEEFVQRRVADADEALEWLVDQGFLIKIEDVPAVPPVYRLNVEKRAEAERLLTRATRAPAQRARRRR